MPRWLLNGLKVKLEEQKVPWDLHPGPRALEQRADTSPHMVLQSDERTGDGFGPAKARGTPAARNLMLMTPGMELLVFARSRESGAVALDHEEQARDIARQLIAALYSVFAGYGGQRWRLQPGRFLTAAELEERHLTQWAGRVYRLGFSWDEAVTSANYKGDGADTVEGGDFAFDTTYETEGTGGNELPSACTEVP